MKNNIESLRTLIGDVNKKIEKLGTVFEEFEDNFEFLKMDVDDLRIKIEGL